MMFNDEYNFGPPSGSSLDANVWKPHPPDLSNHNSKLNTWAPPGTRGNKEFVYDDASAKAAWNGGRPGSTLGGDKPIGAPQNAWGPPGEQLANDLALDQEFLQMNISGKPQDGFGQPAGPQWGRQEVNQSTPWDVDANGAMGRPPFGGPEGIPPPGRGGFIQQPMHFDNGNNQWRQWDNDFGGGKAPPEFSGPPFGGPGMQGQFNHSRMNNFVPQQQPGFNERMPFQIRNGPPFHHGGPHPPQQPWMDNKFGNGAHHQIHHPMGGPNAGGRFPFGHPGQQAPPGGPPNIMMSGRPPLMAMQPPHHPHHPGAVPPNFQMGTFQPAIQNEDAMWQDPNGELRKWQRDTGTAVWGDPAKQNASEIRRWIQPPTDSDEENLLTLDPLREGKDELETGWGPPPAPPGTKGAPGMPHPIVPSGWNEPPRAAPQNFPPGAPNNFHGGPPPANGWGSGAQPGSADWTTRSGPGFNQGPQMGGFEGFGAGGNQETEIRRIADKLRLAVAKDLLDVNLLANMNAAAGCFSNQEQAANTLSLLNNMLDKVQYQEMLEARIKQEGDPSKRSEIERSLVGIKKDLQDYREKIHAALKGSPTRVSLADELTMDEQSNQDLAPSSLGGGVGQLW